MEIFYKTIDYKIFLKVFFVKITVLFFIEILKLKLKLNSSTTDERIATQE